MRTNLFAFAAAAAVALSAGAAAAGDHGPSQYERDNGGIGFQHSVSYGYQGGAAGLEEASIRIVYLNELSKAESAQIKNAGKGAAVQASLDSATTAVLRRHGVQIRNIVGSAQPFKGPTIYFVK
jgi:hypothetical protein